ncbi:MAG: UTP--glucose-1-phosphate uridylyltransferase [Oscillospiraceae bacterium]|nr:UTP--glucose-1-phosphate uridylyltransferase [Oscillospiraceae bacterium]
MKKIRKAVILAAGLGTRVLPATKAVPKEMIMIVDKPAIQYIVEEAARGGIRDIMIVLSRSKSAVTDHFDNSPELEAALLNSGKLDLLKKIEDIAELADITYVRQREMKGTGHAVTRAESFVGGEPFVVIYGDDVIIGDDPATAQVCRAYEEFGLGAVAMKEVSDEAVMKYSSLAVKPLKDNIYAVSDINEKPKKEEILSNFSILGRCALPPEIFKILKKTPPGAGGEIQLTDAMRVLAREKGMLGVDFTGTRYDMGNKLGILQAAVETGLNHEEIGGEFREYLKGLSGKL